MKNYLCIKNSLISQSILASLKIQNYLLIGIGNVLKILDLENKEEISIKVFIAASIHGIKKWPESGTKDVTLLIFGQKSVAVIGIYKHRSTLSFKTILPEQLLEDWIVHATVGHDRSIFILTAHNKCLKLMLLPLSNENDEKIKRQDCKSQITKFLIGECYENSLLYSGIIDEATSGFCILMGGTAFGNIIVWSLLPSCLESERRKPLHILTGPKGTIFSLSFDKDHMLISSTSDDRSVRLWKIICNKKYIDHQSFWENSEISQVFCSYGHAARVWRSLILTDQTILSCGEDAQVCHWSEKGSLLSNWKAHPGTSIWCITAADNIVYTGGGDCALKMWTLHNKAINSKIYLPINDIDNLKLEIKFNDLSKEKTFPRAINLIDSSSAIIVSNSGCLWMWKSVTNKWTLLYENSILQGYIVTSMNKNSSVIALGTLSGFIIIFNIDSRKCISKISVSSSKIQSLIFADEVLLTCSSGIIHIWNLEYDDVNGYLQLVQEHQLPLCRHHWVTAFTFCDVSMSKGEDSLVTGDPSGSVHLYILKKKEPVCTLKGLHGPHGVSSINKSKHFVITSGRDGHIRFLKITNNDLAVVYDMKIQFGKWVCGIFQWKHHLIAPIFNGNKLQFWNVSQDQIISTLECGGGHRSWEVLINKKRFQSSGKLQDFSQNESSLHLVYGYLKDGIPSICTSNFQQRLISEILIPISGREIQSLISLWTCNNKSIITYGGEDTLLYLQFVMRNKIYRINTIKSHLSSIRTMVKIEDYSFMFGHSGSKYCNGKELFILSCGGRAQMKIWKYSLTSLGEESLFNEEVRNNLNHENTLSKSEQASNSDSTVATKVDNLVSDFNSDYFSNLLDPVILCQEIGSHMLKVEKQSHWKSSKLTYDPETRYMDSIAFWITTNIALIVLASSDGFLRIFKYGTENEFEIVHSEDCSFCLLRLSLVKMQENFLLIASTTRGSLIFWDLKKFAELLLRDKLFENEDTNYRRLGSYQLSPTGINSLSVISTESLFDEDKSDAASEAFYLAAGCDSGEIVLAEIKVMDREDEQNQVSISSTNVKILSNSISHAAQVSGLAWIANDLLCSVSIDQRLIVWQLEKEIASIQLTPIQVEFVSIPDIQGLHLIPKGDNENYRKIYVYGSGLQIFDVEIKTKN